MRKLFVIAATLIMCGCASSANQTPEQRAAIVRMIQNMVTNTAESLRITQQGLSRANQQPRPTTPTSCITNYVGSYAYTNCQ